MRKLAVYKRPPIAPQPSLFSFPFHPTCPSGTTTDGARGHISTLTPQHQLLNANTSTSIFDFDFDFDIRLRFRHFNLDTSTSTPRHQHSTPHTPSSPRHDRLRPQSPGPPPTESLEHGRDRKASSTPRPLKPQARPNTEPYPRPQAPGTTVCEHKPWALPDRKSLGLTHRLSQLDYGRRKLERLRHLTFNTWDSTLVPSVFDT